MRKIISCLIICIISVGLIGCSICDKNTDNSLTQNNDNSLKVNIIAQGDSTSLSGMPINLSSELTGEYNKDIQYHWILEKSEQYEDFEGFVAPESGPLKEIVNLGEPVELDLFAEVSWREGAVIEFKVKLQVEEKDSSNIIATDEITIENREGIYKIK